MWDTINPSNLTGAGISTGGGNATQTGIATAAPTPARVNPPWYSPDNPLFWVGGILAATVGLYALSVTAKVGPAKAEVTI